MSPFESAMTLPCSDESRCASSSMFFSTSCLKANITRARRCGFVALHSGSALSAACTAASTSRAAENATSACCAPVFGLKTRPARPPLADALLPLMKFWIARIGEASQGSEFCAGYGAKCDLRQWRAEALRCDPLSPPRHAHDQGHDAQDEEEE